MKSSCRACCLRSRIRFLQLVKFFLMGQRRRLCVRKRERWLNNAWKSFLCPGKFWTWQCKKAVVCFFIWKRIHFKGNSFVRERTRLWFSRRKKYMVDSKQRNLWSRLSLYWHNNSLCQHMHGPISGSRWTPGTRSGSKYTVGAPLLDKGRALNKISQPKPQEVLSYNITVGQFSWDCSARAFWENLGIPLGSNIFILKNSSII